MAFIYHDYILILILLRLGIEDLISKGHHIIFFTVKQVGGAGNNVLVPTPWRYPNFTPSLQTLYNTKIFNTYKTSLYLGSFENYMAEKPPGRILYGIRFPDDLAKDDVTSGRKRNRWKENSSIKKERW